MTKVHFGKILIRYESYDKSCLTRNVHSMKKMLENYALNSRFNFIVFEKHSCQA